MYKLVFVPFLIASASANFFDFFQNQFGGEQQQGGVEDYENKILTSGCTGYLCPGTTACVASPNECPCPFPSSQMKCALPNGKFICVSIPAGENISPLYSDPNSNFNVDFGSDDVRDCGWVLRAYANEKKGK